MQKKDASKTILVIVTGLVITGLILDIRSLQIASACIGVVCIFFPKIALGIEWAWFKLALGLGWVNSKILLSIVYFIFLFPLAWISRLFTKDALQLNRKSSSTIYTDRNHTYGKTDLENIW
ncbi:MAG TPA: hypothetical protein DIW27_03105 [Cytophagales bacterium]|jgi:hypothetical protein|nr:hypothetical protein [Cytophagales bacterium]